MNEAIELHDSTVAGITELCGIATLHLRPAYLHRSQGAPGWNAGTGWVQDFDLVFTDADVAQSFAEFPQQLDTGSLEVGEERFEDIVSLPFARDGEVTFSAASVVGRPLLIRANGVRLMALGEARYVEEFPGS